MLKHVLLNIVLKWFVYYMVFGASITYADNSNEYQIKSAFLYNLARMVEWPNESSNAPLVMCFMGEDVFGNTTDGIANKTIRNRPLTFRKKIALRDADICHILYISPSERSNVAGIAKALGNRAILTVGDMDDFTDHGGMVNLIQDNERINIEVNLKRAERAGLKISSRLLTLAKIVN
ncbi:MAG: YfiR family protein [Thiotrichaceae bacterium]